ncbi:hypothetical protein [Novispirillum itersonii]|uniref:hypothetical protein n=1 Tax=Novispirillum itersonii TaxID=189 RepID=UPI000373FACB|nr:hypothetical protein [Novispirillum itersonii]
MYVQRDQHGTIVAAYANAQPGATEWLEGYQPLPAIDRTAAITARLAAIDAASARPLRAIITNTATQTDHDRLAALEAEAASLRAELNTQ